MSLNERQATPIGTALTPTEVDMSRQQALKLHIIGLGVSETAHLDEAPLKALQSAGFVMGSARQLQTVSHLLQPQQQQLELPKLAELQQQLDELTVASSEAQPSVVAILASGDPLLYGIGRWFSRQFDPEILTFHPGVSSVQAACHRLGLSLQDLQILSLHGRPLAKLRTQLKSNQRLLILTDKFSNPLALAKECIAAGFPDSELTVCEMLGYSDEKIRAFSATDLVDIFADFEAEGQTGEPPLSFDPLHVTVVDPIGPGGVLPEFPGIPDEMYITDAGNGRGMLTKREVRLAILSLMQPGNQDCIWDIGAGCGGVSVELSYWNQNVQVHAIENNPQRLECLQANRERFGVVSNLHVVAGRAPEILTVLPRPNKVFIGGSGGEMAPMLEQIWNTLPTNGVLVVSAVMERTRQQMVGFYDQRREADDCAIESVQVAVSKGDELAGNLLFRPSLPVALFKFTKTASGEQRDD